MADRLAVLIFSVGEGTDDETVQREVSMMIPPPDWTFELGTVVTSEPEFEHLTDGMWK